MSDLICKNCVEKAHRISESWIITISYTETI